MRKNLLIPLFMAIVMIVSPQRVWAVGTQPTSGNGTAANPYQIGTADELLWFMTEVSNATTSNRTAYNAELTADIVINQNVLKADGTLNGTPSIQWVMPDYFYAVFDGKYHTISGIYYPLDGDNCSMFKNNYGTIRNLGVLDSYFGSSGCYHVATFAANNYGTITDCYSFATIDGWSYCGGIAGDSRTYALTNCFYAGKITSTSSTSGPICSDYYANNNPAVHNNYFLASCYNSGLRNDRSTSVTIDEMKSGKVAMLLQAGRTTATVWGQTLSGEDKQDYPVLGGAAVYYSELKCDGTPTADATYTNSSAVVSSHTKDQEVAAVAATCTTEGNIAYYHCSDCHKYYNSNDEEIAENSWVTPASHTKDQEVAAVAATCTTDGNIAYYHCSACHKYYNSSDEEIAENSWVLTKLGHVDPLTHREANAATCTHVGNKEYWYCSQCDTYFKEEACENTYTDDTDETTGVWIAMLAHSFADNFDEYGLKTCSECGKIEGEEPNLVNDASSAFNGYYAISKPGHLVWFRDKQRESVYDAVEDEYTYPYVGINVYLVNNIDMSRICHAADAATGATKLSWDPIGARNNYLGTFDGNNKTITGLYVNGESRNGLFASIGAGSKVKNLTVDGNVTGSNAAIIVSMSYGSVEITNCVSKGSVNSNSSNAAGVLGNDCSGNNAIVTYCTNYATITSTGYNNAGVVGYEPLKVEHCVNYGAVTGGTNTGGVVGYMYSPTNPVADCANYGSVTVTTSGSNVGGVVGYSYGVMRCCNFANVTASSASNVGGISGYTTSGYAYGLKDCLNTGDIKGYDYVGGLSGYLCSANNADSYSTGKVECYSPYAGLLIGCYSNDPSAALSNVYYINGAKVKANGVETVNQVQGTGNTIQTPAMAVESADVASGKLAMLLRGDSETSTWGQDLTNNTYPVLGGPAVYFSGTYQCNGVVLTSAYTNDASQEATIPAHSSEYENNGFCTACHESQTLHGTGTEDDPYLISSVSQLEWYRDQSNAGSSGYTACAKLVNDIDLSTSSNNSWIPISKSYSYKGTFDGNGHTVKNMLMTFSQGGAAGFFGWLDNGSVIKNLTVEGECNTSIYNLGMIAGFTYGSDITNCTVKGRVNNTYSSGGYTGGIVGYNTYSGTTRTFEGCVNYADVSSTQGNVGGILGYMYYPVIISKCANYGNISGQNSYVGGILGYGSYCNAFTMSDCANYGDVTTKSADVAGLVGYISPNSGNVIKDCYVGPCSVRGNSCTYVTTYEPSGSLTAFSNIVYSQDCKVYTSYSATSPATLSNYVAYGSYNTSSAFVGVSAEQIASGEATYLINGSMNAGKWTQDLSDANSQPVCGGDADQYGVYLMGYAHGATARSFSNDANKKNSLHPDADDNGSHDASYTYTSNGDQTHDLLCSVCGHEEHDEDCDMVNDICSKCLYELLSSLQLVDGEAYSRTTAANAASLTYTREVSESQVNKWQALYVPFQMSYDDWKDDFDVATIQNFHEYTDEDGVVQNTVLEVRYVKNGKLKANHPYLIRPKSAGTKTIELTDVTLAKAENKSIVCQSIERKYTFTGTYSPKQNLKSDNCLFMTGGSLMTATDDDVTLKAQRWYLNLQDLDSQVENSSAASEAAEIHINISVLGDDDSASGIEEIKAISTPLSSLSGDIYDMQGRRQQNLGKGLNLIRQDNGNVKKIIIK